MPIERLEVRVTELPIRLQRQVAAGSYDTGPAGQLLGKPVVLKVYADGVVGYSQIRPITPGHFLPDTVHSVLGAIVDILGPHLIGRDLFDLESFWAAFDKLLPDNVNARALIDIALHDAMGKALGVPVYKLLGGKAQSRIPLEWSVGMADDPKGMIDECQRAIQQFGIKILCLKAGHRWGWRQDVKNFVAVREALGAEIVIGVDPNTGWHLEGALRAVEVLREHRLDYLEQPIERRDYAGQRRIRAALGGIPLMADEGVVSLQDAHALVREDACDVLCIKLYKHGGLRPAKKIAAVAEAANLRVNIGGLATLSQLDAAAGAHFYASTPGERVMPAAEFVFGLGALGADPLVPESSFLIKDGHVEPPNGPGLGVAVDDAALDRVTLRQEVVR